MNIKHSLKYIAIVFAAFIIGLVTLVLSEPKWCYDEHLRHTFDRRVLVTPVNRITDEQPDTIKWGVEYGRFADKTYENAYLTPENRRVISIRPYARPALTVGFYFGVEIDSPDDNLEIESNQISVKVKIAGEPDIEFETTSSGRPISLYDGHRGRYFRYRLEYHIKNETIEQLDIEDDDLFSGTFHFAIDGDPYSFDFSSKLRYERRKRSCFGIPGMP